MNHTENIPTLLKEHNEAVRSIEGSSSYQLHTGEIATEEVLKVINGYFGHIPSGLKSFYREVGAIHAVDDEAYSVSIFSVARLIKALSEENKWFKLHSLGLVDVIKYSWVNDRPELDRYMDKETLGFLNDQYKCIGWYRGNWGTEEASYIYFDKAGNFGAALFHQDNFDQLQDQFLIPLLKNSLATYSLYEVIEHGLQKIIACLKEDYGNLSEA